LPTHGPKSSIEYSKIDLSGWRDARETNIHTRGMPSSVLATAEIQPSRPAPPTVKWGRLAIASTDRLMNRSNANCLTSICSYFLTLTTYPLAFRACDCGVHPSRAANRRRLYLRRPTRDRPYWSARDLQAAASSNSVPRARGLAR